MKFNRGLTSAFRWAMKNRGSVGATTVSNMFTHYANLGFDTGRYAKQAAAYATKNAKISAGVAGNWANKARSAGKSGLGVAGSIASRVGQTGWGGVKGGLWGAGIGGGIGGIVGAARNISGDDKASAWGGLKTGAMIGGGFGAVRGGWKGFASSGARRGRASSQMEFGFSNLAGRQSPVAGMPGMNIGQRMNRAFRGSPKFGSISGTQMDLL